MHEQVHYPEPPTAVPSENGRERAVEPIKAFLQLLMLRERNVFALAAYGRCDSASSRIFPPSR
jgi:hypothetical protein